MSTFVNVLLAKRWLRWLAAPAAAVVVVGTVLSQTAPPAIPSVALASEPLYARGARAKPTLTLALSVEFPTVGAQYVGTPAATSDNSYSPTNEYVGYFDPDSCYVYNNAPTETRPSGVAIDDYKRFDRSGAATSHTCGGTAFSGNFMNWATSSAIDILRYGLTGGDRVVDTNTLTVLQRAVLPSGRFWNDSNFPSKRLSAALVAGAIPTLMVTGYTGDVYVANCFNRVHFGTQATGSCSAPGNNSNLGTATSTTHGPVTTYNGSLGSAGGFSGTACASEGSTCAFTGIMQVAYGANNSWKFMSASGGTPCDNATFGDPIVGTPKQCFTRPDPTGWTPPSPANGIYTYDGFFYARVSVCTMSGSTLVDPRSDLCIRYPSGYYKPAGNLQKYSDRIRVAAFGYLNDSTGNPNERYGGVLRAPMKYVGPKYYDSNFSLVSGTNPNQEWDETTGVFVANPDSQTTPSGPGSSPTGPYLSGVTNYLNQFGRTGTFGAYKTYDPVGELYYEALRYLQGLPPTAAATSGMTTVMKDGFPVYDTWTDPHPAMAGATGDSAYACVKNSIVAIGDVNTHNDKSFPGNPAARGTNEGTYSGGRSSSDSANEPDFHYWTQVVGGFESNTAVTYLDGKGVSRTTSNFNSPANTARQGMADQNIGADGASYYMAGAAYWANTHDIRGTNWSDTAKQRPGMRVKTYVLDVNEYAQQTTLAAHKQNQFFLASKYGGFDDASLTGNPYKLESGADSNADWERAGDPGEAKNYYLASSARAVLDGLSTIFESVANQANSIAGGAISTQRLTTVDGFIYQAQFDPASWSGNLIAYTVNGNADGSVTISASPWNAADALATKDPTTRKIYVGKTTATSGSAANEFVWNSLDSDQQTWLQSPQGAASAPVATAQARLLFLRGDRSNEAPLGLGFRKRGTSPLGDIVNSGVAFSGAPKQRFGDTAYSTFYTANSARRKALFVGANDGMLHAFDPDANGAVAAGNELFAYIPSWVVPRLGALTSPTYTHQSYVDATPVVTEALVGTAWKTVLVGGTGAGGQGVYALDVSDPAAFDASKVMWEFTDRDDVDLGNVIGRPQILKVRTGTTSAPAYKYFAVFASGVNNYVDDGRYSTTGHSVIYFLDLSKGTGTAWQEGTNFFKVVFPDPPVGTGSVANGMVGFSVRLGAADDLSQIFAGDLRGNLWKLDFSQATAGTSDWTLAKLSYFKSGTTPIPMYIAKNASGNTQPISMEPALVFGPNRSLYVSFGTGKFLEVPDIQAPYATQSVYTIFDNNSATPDSSSPVSAIAGRGRLQAGSFDSSTGVLTVSSFVWGRPATDATTTSRAGWYFDFATSGERQVSNFGVLAGYLIFGSVIPPVNSCDDGAGNLYVVDVGAGNGTRSSSPVGLLGEPFLGQVNASSLTTSDSVGLRTETARYQIILQGSKGLAAPTDPRLNRTITSVTGRLSWREISNYQQLRNTP